MLVSALWHTGGSTTENDPALTLTMPRERDPAPGGFAWRRNRRPGFPDPWPPAHILGQPLRPLCRSKYKSHTLVTQAQNARILEWTMALSLQAV